MLGREIWTWLGGKVWSPERLAQYIAHLVLIVVIVTAAILIYQVVSRLFTRLLVKDKGLLPEGKRRTILPLLNSLLKYVIGFVVLVMVLHQIGVNYTAILAGAGVVGLAVGFGAQTLVRDFISGAFILFEGLIEVGDFIEVGDTSGTVEQVGLRTTQYRSFNGALHTIPNGELTRFGNYNRGFCRAVVEVGIPYEKTAQEVMAKVLDTARVWAANRADIVLEEPQLLGMMRFADSAIMLTLAVKVKPQTQWPAERELRLALKEMFDREGIAIPYPQRVVRVASGTPESKV
jgi:small conductance mechanosensitive channel